MAIDSSLFAADLPAATYTKGDVISLGCVAGPATVRSGRGAAILKRLTTGILGDISAGTSYFKISVKNSDWIDPMISYAASIRYATALDERSGCVQRGNDCPLTPNSSWEIVAECVITTTTTSPNTIFALLDVDYPQVSSIIDPDILQGIPSSIDYEPNAAINVHALGSVATAKWDIFNVDFFKAGYEYALQKVEIIADTGMEGFIALANAAGMGGLQRIMPISGTIQNVRNKVEYATKLQKGPMDIKFLMFANSGTPATSTPDVLLDFVKRRM